MLSLFCLAILAQTVTSLPALPSPDDAGLLSTDLGLDPNQSSTVGTDPGTSFSSLDSPQFDNPDALLSQQLALNVDSSSSAPPPASQNAVDAGCDKAPNGKRDTEGAETNCPAVFTNPAPGTTQEASPKKAPEGQQQQPNSASLGPTNAKPKKPGERGDVRFNQPDEPVSNPFGEKDKEPQCPSQYRYTVCGVADSRFDTWGSLYTVHDAALVINSGFGYGMVVRPEWKNRGGIAGWTDALDECGPEPRKIFCCNVYFEESRQAYVCEPLEAALKSQTCWEGVMGLPSQTVLECIENL